MKRGNGASKAFLTKALKTFWKLLTFVRNVIFTWRKQDCTKGTQDCVPSISYSGVDFGINGSDAFTVSCQAKVDPNQHNRFSVKLGDMQFSLPKEYTHDGIWHNFVFSSFSNKPLEIFIDGRFVGYQCIKCNNMMDKVDSHDDDAMCEVQQVLNS